MELPPQWLPGAQWWSRGWVPQSETGASTLPPGPRAGSASAVCALQLLVWVQGLSLRLPRSFCGHRGLLGSSLLFSAGIGRSLQSALE